MDYWLSLTIRKWFYNLVLFGLVKFIWLSCYSAHILLLWKTFLKNILKFYYLAAFSSCLQAILSWWNSYWYLYCSRFWYSLCLAVCFCSNWLSYESKEEIKTYTLRVYTQGVNRNDDSLKVWDWIIISSYNLNETKTMEK